jgi:hypothetical protein
MPWRCFVAQNEVEALLAPCADAPAAVLLVYQNALAFVTYMDAYWVKVAEEWCAGGRARAAEACGIPKEAFPSTTNHAESCNNFLKHSRLPGYAVSCFLCFEVSML